MSTILLIAVMAKAKVFNAEVLILTAVLDGAGIVGTAFFVSKHFM